MSNYGYIKSPSDIRDYKLNKTYTAIKLPDSYEVNHSHIKNQGNVGSCVAHSVTEILETVDDVNYSTGWIYGYRPIGYYQGVGMIPSEALKTIRKVGYIENNVLDINVEMPEAKKAVNRDIDYYERVAESHTITSYARLKTINDIKKAIYNINMPVMVAIDIGVDGLQLDENYIAQIPNEYDGGHQLVCYGWNETGLLIQNSWGDNWGKNGTFILPYEYPISEAWAIIINEYDDKAIIKPNFFKIRQLLHDLWATIKNILKI